MGRFFIAGMMVCVLACLALFGYFILPAALLAFAFPLFGAESPDRIASALPPAAEVARMAAYAFGVGAAMIAAAGLALLVGAHRPRTSGRFAAAPAARFSVARLAGRVRGVVTGFEDVHHELEGDRVAQLEALGIVLAVSTAVSLPKVLALWRLGDGNAAGSALLTTNVLGVAGWVLISLIGAGLGRFFGSAVPIGAMLASLGYAASPLALTALGAPLPVLLPLLHVSAGLWAVLLAIRAVYALLGIGAMSTLATCTVVVFVMVVFSQIALGSLLGPPAAVCDGFIDGTGGCTPWEEVPPEVIRALGTPTGR